MSSRVVLEALRRLGGEATLQQLQQAHYLAAPRLRSLQHQGYVERTPEGTWRLTAMARTPAAAEASA